MKLHSKSSRSLLIAASIATMAMPALAQQSSAPAIIQFFESSSLNTQRRAADMFVAGYGQIWTPPPGRADSGNQSVGYDQYDRFDLGNADNPTLYGTENTLKRSITELHRAGMTVYSDLVLNHNGFSTYASTGFVNAGGYPGFVAGDFHNTNINVDNDQYNGRTSGLIDIDQYTQNLYVRNPVPGATNNIPAGTYANVPNAANRRFYQNRDRAADRTINGTPIWDFTSDTATTGDPVQENAMGYLQRNAQWMIQSIGVDGFRLDATKHIPVDVLNSYFDVAVSGANRRLNLDGSTKSVFSFGENFDTNKSYLQTYVNKGTSGNLVHNRDTIDFPLFYGLKENLIVNSTNNSWLGVVNSSFDSNDDGNANNGSQGVGVVESADTAGADLGNVAYAYSLMRPGNQIVYFNAHGVGSGRNFPRDGRGDALGGQYGDAITKLVGLRNTHGRGNYIERWLEKGTLIYERDKSAIVGLSNLSDNGYDTRTVQTNFAAGTRLLEMTGNATDPLVDPHDNLIPDYVVVNSSGQITINVPRNHNIDGGVSNKGYVVYGLPTPQGTLSIPDRASTIAGGTPTAATNGTTRLAALEVVNGNSFTISLNTATPVIGGYTDTAGGGDNALFSINGGVKPDGTGNDLNGNGNVDFTSPSNTLVYGFEQFVTKRSPLVGGGAGGTAGDGQYRQTIDATKLVEGFNYLEVRAFRSRPAGEPAVYSSFKKVIYVDRIAADSTLTEVKNVGNNDRAFRITNADGTADNVHAFLDLGSALTNAQVLALVNSGSQSSQIDSTLWSKTFGSVGTGNHNVTFVTYEPSGRATVKRLIGQYIATGRGLGLGDINYDGIYGSTDAIGAGSIETALYSRGAIFNAAADLNADGNVDNRDLLALLPRYQSVGASANAIAGAQAALSRRGDVDGDASTTPADIDFLRSKIGASGDVWLFDLNQDGAVTQVDLDSLVTDFLRTRVGDTNLDRKVNFDDLVTVSQNYNAGVGGWGAGDFDGDGDVTFNDLVSLAQNYNFNGSASLAAANALQATDPAFAADWALAQAIAPEPASLTALLACSATLVRRRRPATGFRSGPLSRYPGRGLG